MATKYPLTEGQTEEAQRVLRDVQTVCGILPATVLSDRRDTPTVSARFLASAALRGAGWTHQATADAIKWNDHASTMHASGRFDDLVETDKPFKARAKRLASMGWTLQGRNLWMDRAGVVRRNG